MDGTWVLSKHTIPEEILVRALLKQGVSVEEIIRSLCSVGISPHSMRAIFKAVGGQVFGVSIYEPTGWLMIKAGRSNGDNYKIVEWGPAEDCPELDLSEKNNWQEAMCFV